MKRLTKQNLNTSGEYSRIFKENLNKEFDSHEKRRWKLLLKQFKGGKLLDVGCFNSPLCMRAKQRFPNSQVFGLDFVLEILDWNRKHYPGITYLLGDALNTPFKDGYFDYVVAGQLLEHLEEPEKFIKEAMRILKYKGN